MCDEQIVITLPLPVRVLQPNCTIASFGGRMMKASATKRYRRLAHEAVEEANVESMPWEYAIVEATFYFKNARKRDQDNFMGSLKSAYDGIVDSGLIPDDDYKHMQRGMPTFSTDKKCPRVDLMITRILPPEV